MQVNINEVTGGANTQCDYTRQTKGVIIPVSNFKAIQL